MTDATPEKTSERRLRKKGYLKVMEECDYDFESAKKRLKSARKMVDDALEEIDWDLLQKLIESYHDRGLFDHFNRFRLLTRWRLKFMFKPGNWAPRWDFYMYNHYIYTEPCARRQPPVVDSLSLEDRQRMRVIRRQAVNDSLELVAHQHRPEIPARGGCQIVDRVRNPAQLRKIAGMARKGSLAGLVGLAAGYSSLSFNEPVR